MHVPAICPPQGQNPHLFRVAGKGRGFYVGHFHSPAGSPGMTWSALGAQVARTGQACRHNTVSDPTLSHDRVPNIK